MASIRRIVGTGLGIAVVLTQTHQVTAQTATVDLTAQKQLIRGIGGMAHAAWAGDLTAAQRTLAFGNATGQLGFTALRIPVTDGSPDSANVATAKAAIAAGAIVFATPWNGSGAMDSSQFSTYATHLNDFVTYMKNQGVELYAIGTQNEPDYGAQGGWRTWTAAQCHDFMLNYGATIKTKLLPCESFSYAKNLYDPILNDSAALANVGALGTHLYGTSVNNYAYPLADSKAAGKERWMTEHYTDSTTDANSWPNALGVATELHHAMVEGQFSLYTWWYIVRGYGPIHSDSTVTKRGWCMAHFSKFIRPGFYRVNATASPVSGVYLSAYKGASDVVLVAVNTSTSTQSLTISVAGSDITSFDKYTTSSSKNLSSDGAVKATGGSLSVTLDGQSVTTLHGSGSLPDAGTSTSSSSTSSSSSGSSSGSTSSSSSSGSASGSSSSGASTTSTSSSGSTGTSSSGGASASSSSTSSSSGGGAASSSSSAGAPSASSSSSGSSTSGAASSSGGEGVGGAASASHSTTHTASSGGGVGGGAGSGPGAADSGGEESSHGCSCRVGGKRSNTPPLGLLGMIGVMAACVVRRRARAMARRSDVRP